MTRLIDRKILVFMLFLATTMMGVISYRQLDVELLPNTELPVLYVRVQGDSETDPKYMEQIAVIPLEGVIGTLEDIESIESSISAGNASIMVTLTKDASITASYLKLTERIKTTVASLPDGYTASVIKVDMDNVSNQFMSVQVRGTGGVDRVRNVVDQELSDRFQNIDGIAAVEIFGGREKSLDIITNEKLLDSYGITLGQIQQNIAGQQNAKTFAGSIIEDEKEHFVTIESDYNSLDEIKNIVLKTDGPIRLKDVASVDFGVKEEDSYSRVNGMDAVTITLARESQTNLIDLANKVLDETDIINQEYKSQNIELSVEYNSAETMESNIDNVISLALTGGILAIFLLWVFLRNIYLVFVAMVAIPVSVYSAFNFFYGAGVSINILTLVGLALAVGMLIDNNVVVMENIHRLASRGGNFRDSVIKGTGQVWKSVTASTFTTVVVFLPFVFSSNIMFRQVARHISVSIVATLLISLVTALVLVPVLTLAFLKNKNRRTSSGFANVGLHNRVVQVYMQLLKASLRRPAVVTIGALILLFITLFASLAISLNTSEEVETATYALSIERSTGSTLESTDIVVRELESRLSDLPEKPDVISQIYSENATISIRLPENYDSKKDRSIGEIRQDIQSRITNIPGTSITLSQSVESGSDNSMSGSMGSSMTGLFGIGAQTEKVVIKGDDFDQMLLVANDVKYYLEENLENLTSVNVSVSSLRPEVHLDFDALLMGLFEVTPTNVARELNTFRNEISSGGTFKLNNETYDINIKTDEDKDSVENSEDVKTMSDLTNLQVETSSSSVVPLNKVSQIYYAYGRPTIKRVDQGKIIEVTYRFSDEVNNSKTLLESSRQDVEDLVNLVPVPANVAVSVIHEENQFEEFKFLILIAVLLIYMILASVFESFSAPFVMMFTVPLAATGSLLALTLTGSSLLSLNTLVGFLILLGIVVNNGIILMDYVAQLRSEGNRYIRSLMLAGISRIRPVVITAGTTIIAMVPLAMGQSEYVGSLGAPFAITVIGGLGFSTLLTLVFVPSFAYGLDTALSWIRNQNIFLLAIMIVGWVTGLVYTFFISDVDLSWQLIYMILVIGGIPTLTFFVTNSLKQANTTLISNDQPIVIRIQNLVKIYGRPSRFVREWQSRRKNIDDQPKDVKINYLISEVSWQIGLIAFSIYFIWFYASGGFTLFIGSVLFYLFMPLFFKRGAGRYLLYFLPQSGIIKMIPSVYYYGYPIIAAIIFQFRWNNLVGILFLIFIWYICLGIEATGKLLRNNIIQIPVGKGFINRIKRFYFLAIRQLPWNNNGNEPFKALKGINLEFKPGMIGLLGPNGAGKTTLMRIICGILDQSYGKIFINDIDTSLKREELQGLIGYLPQEFGMYENMTAVAFLDYMALLKGILNKEERQARIEYVLKAVHMWERGNETIGSYSGGMKQRVGIAMILLHLPRILVVDEPTAGLDPSERIRFRNLLVELSRERIVIFSTHIIEDISSSCNQVAVIVKGDLKYWGTPMDMVLHAKNKVWEADIEEPDFDRINKQYKITHHIKTGNKIRIRCISEIQPFESAKTAHPVLEDAYLLMLDATRNNNI